MLTKSDKETSIRGKRMNDVCYAQNLFREAFPERRHGSVKAALFEGYRFLSRRLTKEFTIRRAKSIRLGTARRIDSEEMEALKQALIEESKREQHEIRARLASLDEKIAAYEAAAHRESLASSGGEMGR